MISTKDLSGLPNAERLKNFCKGLAALDIIMVEEEWSFIRHYTYDPAWRKGKEAFFATDGSDQSMIVMFAPEGCVINGVDSELYDWEEKLPRIEDLTDGMPPALRKLMGSREVKKDEKYLLRLDGRWHHMALQSHGRRGRIQRPASPDRWRSTDLCGVWKVVLPSRPAFGDCAPAC